MPQNIAYDRFKTKYCLKNNSCFSLIAEVANEQRFWWGKMPLKTTHENDKIKDYYPVNIQSFSQQLLWFVDTNL